MSLLVRMGAVAALLGAAALLAAGCGETVIDSAKTEGAIEENLEKSVGQKVSSVECPSGVKVEKGKTFECTVKLQGGKTETATLKILNSNADVELADIKSSSSGK
jgi:hypothetical protein